MLILNSNKISEIKGIENLTRLKEISFYKNNISKVRDFPQLPELQEVDLIGNPISSNDIKDIQKMFGANVNVFFS